MCGLDQLVVSQFYSILATLLSLAQLRCNKLRLFVLQHPVRHRRLAAHLHRRQVSVTLRKQNQRGLAEVPRMSDLTGFGQFLQNLKNQGMHPYLMGDFPVSHGVNETNQDQRKPYLVR